MEEDDNAYAIGNLMMHLEENTSVNGKDELEMLTEEDLSSNGLFGEKLITTLNNDDSGQDPDAEAKDYSNDRNCEDLDVDSGNEETSTRKYHKAKVSSATPINSKGPLSNLYHKSKRTQMPSVTKSRKDTEINKFNKILSLNFSQKMANPQSKADDMDSSIVEEILEDEKYDSISRKVYVEDSSNDGIYGNEMNSRSHKLDRYKNKLGNSIPSTSKSLSSLENPGKSQLQDSQEITIMKEEMISNVSDLEELTDRMEDDAPSDHSMVKIASKERMSCLIRRKRPVIHRKCKIKGKKDNGKTFKSRFLSRCLMKYGPNTENTNIQKFDVSFQCEQCEYSTNNRSNYKNHLLIHGEERLYHCPFCPYRSKQSAGLRAHYKVHSVEKPFTCSFCHYKSKRKQNLVQHLKIHAKEKPFRCEECPFQASTKQILQSHLLWHITQKQNGIVKDDDSDYYECVLCHQVFTSEDELASHYQSHADETIASSAQETKSLDIKTRRKLEKANLAFKCYQCDFITLRKCAFRNHVKSHNKLVQKCELCNYKCDSPSKLGAHMESHKVTLRDNECPYCAFKAMNQNDLECHLNERHSLEDDRVNERLETVNISDFSSPNDNQFEYKCPFCKFTCLMGEVLKVHICNHSNDDLKFYSTNCSPISNHLEEVTNSNSLEKELCIYENPCSDVNGFGVQDGGQGYNAKYNNTNRNFAITSLPSKRSFNDELLSPVSDGNSANAARQSSYSTYNNNRELGFETSYEDCESKYEQVAKRLKNSSSDVHNNTLHDSGFTCNSSFDGANEEIEYESTNAAETVNMSSTMNQGAMIDNYMYPKADNSHSYINKIESSSILPFPVLSSSTIQEQLHDQDNDLNTESFRMLFHALENSNLDHRSKQVQAIHYMRNETLYDRYNSNNTVAKHEIVKSNNFPYVDSCMPISTYSAANEEDILQIRMNNNSTNYLSQYVNGSLFSGIQRESHGDVAADNLLNTHSELFQMQPLVEGCFINADLEDPQANNSIRNPFQELKDYDEPTLQSKDYMNTSNLVKNITSDAPTVRNDNKLSDPSSSSGVIDMERMHSNTSNELESFDKKFERYALSDQNEMEVNFSEDPCCIEQLSPEPVEESFPDYTLENEKPDEDSSNEAEIKSFPCSKCDATFLKKSSLNNHSRVHNFRCSSCSYKTKCKKSLLQHRKKHAQETTFRCVQCDFTTFRKCSLISHNRSHTQLYICAYCGFQCRLLKELELHSISHGEPMSIKCMFCEFTSGKHKMLKYHMKKHTSNPAYKCTRCSFGFQTEEEFNCHIEAHQTLDKQKLSIKKEKSKHFH